MGAAVAMSRGTFDRIGGWNDEYFVYYEDAEIRLRALESGISTYVDGDVNWQHGWARETSRGFSMAAWKREFASAVKFYSDVPSVFSPSVPREASLCRRNCAMT